ncbi:polypeptide N-acetylgalactosaminyltransferase 2 [Aplysia californica]|uniref:Polypeptide N-acetylgalactosaminyltransferase n=1 Tax=Aplysia californica TaxID=6500 RepID=A0ABM0JYN2_APLCA|nr:polypeptide N-acetylgalactosaminyltransferase 2 [Aplysia californica]
MMKPMRRNKCVVLLVFLLLCSIALIFWQIIWSMTHRDLPSSFDVSLLQHLSYVESAPDTAKQDLSRRYGYNIVNSRAVKPNRSLPDLRHASCGVVTSSIKHELPSPSIIVTFRDEDRSVLLRNIVSILTKSSPVTLREIILVDDGSRNAEDGHLLSQLPGVQVIRNEQPTGRGAARVKGMQAASGDVIVFVDSLAEVNVNWLSPLLLRILQSPKSLVSPILDSIDHVTFGYRSLPGIFRGGFDWTLEHRWEDVPLAFHTNEDVTAPIRSPTLCGSVLAVRKDFFSWLGKYDLNPMSKDIEDLELTMRAWMCGGQVEIIPCSRVGLIQAHGRELGSRLYIFNNYLRGARRLAEVWLEEFKRFFYAVRPSARMQPLSDVSSQRKLKGKLKCKNFKWFLTSVYPQLQPLITDEVAYGSLKQGENCVDLDPGQLPLVAKLRRCEPGKDSQEWSWRKRGVIVSSGMCLTSDMHSMQGFVQVQFCKDAENQIWYRHNEKIVHQDTNLCLDGIHGNKGLLITECIKQQASQAWEISREEPARNAENDYLEPGVVLL